MYIGRFAPSPTGQLHFGSLLAALASYLDAKAQQGQWLLRIENIDPPREIPESSHRIPQTLEAFGFEWDQDILYQSQQNQTYQAALDRLTNMGLTYVCNCSRKQIINRSGQSRYDRYCRSHYPAQIDKPPKAGMDSTVRDSTVRFAVPKESSVSWLDAIQGKKRFTGAEIEDCILRRKDNLWSYHLAVTADDIAQQITHVVRGYDLLVETPKQLLLHQALSNTAPHYAHIPIILGNNGQKLSKQNFAEPLNTQTASLTLLQALAYLNISLPDEMRFAEPNAILQAAIPLWDITRIPAQASLPLQHEIK